MRQKCSIRPRRGGELSIQNKTTDAKLGYVATEGIVKSNALQTIHCYGWLARAESAQPERERDSEKKNSPVRQKCSIRPRRGGELSVQDRTTDAKLCYVATPSFMLLVIIMQLRKRVGTEG